jgi:hypothetical protein
MSDIETGGPAFPCTQENWDASGMTLRDYFAAKSLQGMLANQHQFQADDEPMFARDAYKLADAMLQARKGCAA